jgi:hypothetical protein
MGSFFLWLSGTDKELLAQCTNLRRSERIRLQGLGALVLVPATLALFSMAYAVSTVTSRPIIFVTAGLIWASIILAIDRYLVTTINKSTEGRTAGRGLSILIRFIFAIFVGVAVAHPFILLWFHDSTSQQRFSPAESCSKREGTPSVAGANRCGVSCLTRAPTRTGRVSNLSDYSSELRAKRRSAD